MFGESREQDGSRSRRRRDDLILMRGGNGDALSLDDAVAGCDVIDMPSDAQPLSDFWTMPPRA